MACGKVIYGKKLPGKATRNVHSQRRQDGLYQRIQKRERPGGALVGAAMLDEKLRQLLDRFFIDDKKERENLLDTNQPLGTFSARIRMAYCLGLISKKVFKDLNRLRDIRNDFAHHLRKTFSDPDIEQKCSGFQVVNDLKQRETPWEFPLDTQRQKFEWAVYSLLAAIDAGLSSIQRLECMFGPN